MFLVQKRRTVATQNLCSGKDKIFSYEQSKTFVYVRKSFKVVFIGLRKDFLISV